MHSKEKKTIDTVLAIRKLWEGETGFRDLFAKLFYGKDMEFGMFALHKTGFVVNDREVGRTKCVCGEDDYYDDGTKFSLK